MTRRERHRNHADDHRQRGHENWTKPRGARLNGGFHRVTVVKQALFGERDYQDAVGSGDSHTHDGSGERRHTQRCMREKEKKHDARQSRRESGNNDERVQPRLEVHHNQQVDENDCKTETGQQTPVRGSHGFELALD